MKAWILKAWILITLPVFLNCNLYGGRCINYGTAFNNEHVQYVKSIKRPENCAEMIEKFAIDSLNGKACSFAYFQINEFERSLSFYTSCETFEKNQRNWKEYLVVFDSSCSIVHVGKYSPYIK